MTSTQTNTTAKPATQLVVRPPVQSVPVKNNTFVRTPPDFRPFFSGAVSRRERMEGLDLR
jgi:hypothetical protein